MVKNQPDATRYAVLLPQHVSGTNMPIIRSTISEYLPLLGGHTWKAAWVVLHWISWGEHCSEDVASLATSSKQCSLLAAQRYTAQVAFQIWPPKSRIYSLIVLPDDGHIGARNTLRQ
jgi:hypothetical protein